MMATNVCELDSRGCTGCGSCVEVCPRMLLSIAEDKRGFQKVFISSSKDCVKCGRCLSVCHRYSVVNKNQHRKIYATRNKSDFIVQKSSSGGFFYSIAKYVLDKGGVVFGASLDSDFVTRHIEVDNVDDICKLQKSKYVQSITVNVHKDIWKRIKEGRFVLFSGTPCQVASVKTFLDYYNIESSYYLLIEVICYGTPSKKVVRDYLSCFGKNNISDIAFRDNKKHSAGYMSFKDGKEIPMKHLSHLFGMKYSLTDNCFECKYKGLSRVSDITMGDFWGLETIEPQFFKEIGNSMILLNTAKGEYFFKEIKNDLEYTNVEIDDLFMDNYQPALISVFNKPKLYDEFWRYYEKKGLQKAYNLFVSRRMVYRILRKIKKVNV